MKMTEDFASWCRANGKEKLLALYDESNIEPAEKAAFSSAKIRKWHCPVCGMSWTGNTNKMNRLSLGHYNVIKKRPEETYCPYCAGARVSPYYSLLTERPWIREFWDEERNGQPVEVLENEKPNTHKKFFFRCKKCGYSFPKPIAPRDIDEALHCPECGDGKSREVTDRNCLAALFPQIAKELADDLNEGITGWNIRPSYRERRLWFRCPDKGHPYQEWVYNRTGRGDGCPLCNRRKKTSFAEQAIFYYIKRCARDVWNNQRDRGASIDIILQEKQLKVEYNSLYYHKQVRYEKEGLKRSLEKYRELSRYDRVFVVTEWEEEAKMLAEEDSPLICPILVPVYTHTKTMISIYNQKILELLQLMFPDRESYPSIDIQRDELEILAQYVNGTIENSFQEQYPQLAKDWDWQRNGMLAPNMFAPNSRYKFYWICRTCGRSYQMSMINRQKVNPDTCPFCCRKSHFPSPLLAKCYPELRIFWNRNLNRISFDNVSVASEQIGVFNLLDGELVPVRICNLSNWLWNNPDRRPEEYLQILMERQGKKWRHKS